MARIDENVFRQYRDGQDRMTAREYMTERELLRQAINDVDSRIETAADLQQNIKEIQDVVRDIEDTSGQLQEVKETVEDLLINGTGIDAQAREGIQTVTSQLADTVKEVNGVKPTNGKVTLPIPEIDTTNLVKKNDVLSMANMGQDVKEAMTGGSVAVVGKDAVHSVNVVNKAITPEKVSFMNDTNPNILDITESNYSWTTNQPESITFSSNGFTVKTTLQSGIFFKVNIAPNKPYSLKLKGTNFANVRVLKSDKTTQLLQPGIDANGYYTGSFSSSEDHVYLRFWVNNATTAELLEYGIVSGLSFTVGYALENKIKITNGNIPEKEIQPSNCNFFTIGKNIFDKSKSLDGFLVNGNGGGTLMANESQTVSDWTPCEPNKSYICNDNCNYAFYNSDGVFISGKNSHIFGTEFTSPTNAYLIRVSFAKTKKDTFQLEQSTWVTPYEPYKIVLQNKHIPSTTTHDWYYNKKLTTFGDSITAQGRWQPYLMQKFGFSTHTNCGIGGSKIIDDGNGTGFVTDARINAIPTDSDVILVMGGTNDMGQNIPLGDLTYPYDITKFKSALAETIRKVQNRCPNALIVVMSPLSGRGKVDGENATEPVKNTLGLTTEDYANAVREVARFMSTEFIDVFGKTGINQFNRIKYIPDSVHPNELGGKAIARVVINGLKSMEPIN